MAQPTRKIFLFVTALLTIVVIFGAAIYLIEGPKHGFVTIPTGMYWAIATMATVGCADLSPVTALGRIVASVLILIGYSIIAVPTRIYTVELASGLHDQRGCTQCGLEGHDPEALHCRG